MTGNGIFLIHIIEKGEDAYSFIYHNADSANNTNIDLCRLKL